MINFFRILTNNEKFQPNKINYPKVSEYHFSSQLCFVVVFITNNINHGIFPLNTKLNHRICSLSATDYNFCHLFLFIDLNNGNFL